MTHTTQTISPPNIEEALVFCEASQKPADSRVMLDPLTTLRFFAALGIVIIHAEGMKIIHVIPDTRWHHSMGHLIEFFFTLSGFVLAYNYRDLSGWQAKKDYLINRIARIAPLYYLTGIASMAIPAVVYGMKEDPMLHVGIYLFFIQDWLSDAVLRTCINGPAHSVTSEVFFYTLFIGLAACKRSFKPIVYLFVLLAILLNFNFIGIVHPPVHLFPVNGLQFFLIGGLAAFLFEKMKQNPNPSMIRAIFFTVLEIGIFFPAAFLSYNLTSFSTQDVSWVPYQNMGLALSLLAVSFASIVVLYALEQGFLSKLFKAKILVTLGLASYTLFLIHYPLMLVFKQIVGWYAVINPVVGFLVSFSIIALSVPVYFYIEHPCRKIIIQAFKGNISKVTMMKQLTLRWVLPLAVVALLLPYLWSCTKGPDAATTTSDTNTIQNQKPDTNNTTTTVANDPSAPSAINTFDEFHSNVIPGTKNIQFGDIELIGAKVESFGKEVKLVTLWKDNKNTFDKGFQITHLIDSEGNIIRNLDHPMTRTPSNDGTWIDMTVLPKDELKKVSVKSVALAVCIDTRCILFPIKGEGTEIIGGRLIVPLARSSGKH